MTRTRMLRLLGPALGCCLLLPSVAFAVPFKFSYSGVALGSPTIPGVSAGDAISIDVMADNGGVSTISQIWNFADLISAQVAVGTYSATYTTDFFSLAGDPVFLTDATGLLTSARFQGTSGSLVNFDIFGTGGFVRLFANAMQDFNGKYASFTPTLGRSFGNTAGWGRMPVGVPEPSTLALMAIGLVGVAFARRRKLASQGSRQ